MDLGESQLQVRLLTKQESIAIPDVPFAVPSTIEHNSLNELVNLIFWNQRN
jgi:hypothetical protein